MTYNVFGATLNLAQSINQSVFEMYRNFLYLHVIVDFPQVHTVTRFIAREPDELDLEEADVVSVYQKSPDGQ